MSPSVFPSGTERRSAAPSKAPSGTATTSASGETARAAAALQPDTFTLKTSTSFTIASAAGQEIPNTGSDAG